MDVSNMHRTIIFILGISLTVSAYENSQLYVPCKEGWYFFGEKCYKLLGLNKTEDYISSQYECSREGQGSGNLASIYSKESQEFLTVFFLLTAKSNVWIGLNDMHNESFFSWEDGSNFNYTNWDSFSDRPWSFKNSLLPIDCVAMQYHEHKDLIGKWVDLRCDKHSLPYICQVNKSADTNSPDPRFCSFEEGGGWKNFNSCYHVVKEEKSWEDAEKYCEDKFNGYLVTISDSDKDMFINYILKSDLPKDVWIGIKLQNNVTSQKWASGWHVAYYGWNPKPLRFENGTCALKSIQNSWEVKQCHDKHPFICEKMYNVPVMKSYPSGDWKCPNSSIQWLDLEGDSCYYIENEKPRNWFEANYECGRIGGTFASFHSEEETNVVHPHVVGNKHPWGLLFIGLKRSPVNRDVFEWADGTEVNYENWDSTQYKSIDRRDCVGVRTHTMDWLLVPCDGPRGSNGYICKSKKVFSKVQEISTPVPCSCVVPKDQSYTGGIPVGTAVGIVFCTLLVVLLVGVIVYHSRNFWNRYCMKTLNVGSTPASDSVDLISDKVIWKPLKREHHK